MKEIGSEIPDWKEIAFSLEGKLLRRQEIPYDKRTIHQLLDQNYLHTIPAIRKYLLFNKCTRCFNENPAYFAKIPCKTCNTTHVYCRKCIEMGRMMECEPLYFWSGPEPGWPKAFGACSWTGKLTPAQQSASNQIKKVITGEIKELLIWAVTGAGKTEMLFPGITLALEMGLRICIATPRADVVRELLPRFETAFETIKIHALYGGSKDKSGDAQLILATTHQLLRFKEAFDVIIIDEIDAFPYNKDSSLPLAAKRAGKSDSRTIYLTATPRKHHKKRMKQKNLPYVFVPVRYHGHPLPVPKMKMVFSLSENLRNYQSPNTFIHWLKNRKKPSRQLLIFLPTIALSEGIKSAITKKCLQLHLIKDKTELDSVHSQDPYREEKVTAFREKKLKVIITTTILERGVTFPSVDVAIIDAGYDVFDEAALVQIAGRAGRNGEDPTGEVVFFHDGKTEAMTSAIRSIKQMNRRGGFK